MALALALSEPTQAKPFCSCSWLITLSVAKPYTKISNDNHSHLEKN
jgi:hypothetical protein